MGAPGTLNGADARQRLRVDVAGVVQGVGFRPFVYREAVQADLAGFVANTGAGVLIEAEGSLPALTGFVNRLREGAPAGARVWQLRSKAITPTGERGFVVRESVAVTGAKAAVLPDLATCEECLSELFDPGNRRYRYPFLNCTHCGPRYSIVDDLPYDRARTSMRGFVLCAECRTEYEDPANRRFHAEANACPACGPQLSLWDSVGAVICGEEAALQAAAAAIREGGIVAIKGLGGLHLAVDARNEVAVRRLRQRKHREEKPFAVMFPTMAAIREHCDLNASEEALVAAPERPIVIVRGRGRLSDAVAPGNPSLGVMLPYTPLHHLLAADLNFPVVATSGNRSDEPIVTDEHEAVERLAGIADLFLIHNRPIVRPIDDSVARILGGRPMLLRRGRGYAPGIALRRPMPEGILALGGHLKAAVALTAAEGVILGQHIGDLDTGEARDVYDRARADIGRLRGISPRLVVRDLHPGYHSSAVAEACGVPSVSVQHHLAHVVAAMADNEITGPALGVAWDGTGHGPDGTIWGGEFLKVTDDAWRRVGNLRPFRLPGGDAAVREPRRSALGLLFAAYGEEALTWIDLPPVAAFSAMERATLAAMLKRGVNAPVTTSAGRLFDAVAALVGQRQRATYEGQAAAELEWMVAPDGDGRSYSFPVRERGAEPLIVDWRPALDALIADIRGGMPPAKIARAFHLGLAEAIAKMGMRIGEEKIVLTGGCFQNAFLTEAAIAAIRRAGLTPFWHRSAPPNDGGLALGQAVWAAGMVQRGEVTCA